MRKMLIAWLAVFTAVIFSAPVPTQAMTWPSHIRAPSARENHIAWAVHHLLNKERAAHGLRPLKMNSHLRLSARRHDRRMRHYNELSHQFPGEPWVGQREINAGYYWSYTGENIAFNTDMTKAGALLLERLMYRHREHRLNILSHHYRHVGVDIWFDWLDHIMWLTCDFGRPASLRNE